MSNHRGDGGGGKEWTHAQSRGVTELSGKSWESGEPTWPSSQSKVLRRESCWDRTLCSAFPKSILLGIRKPVHGMKLPRPKKQQKLEGIVPGGHTELRNSNYSQ